MRLPARFGKQRRAELAIVLLVLLFYLLNRFTPAFSFLPFDFAQNHFNDLCGGILIPAYCNLVLLCSRVRFRFDSVLRIILLELTASFCWEVIAPMLLSYSTADLVDAACYILGGLIYYMIEQVIRTAKHW